MRTILSTDLTPNAFKANKKSKKSKNTFRSTDGGVNITITEKENSNADEKKPQAVPVASTVPILHPQLLPTQQTVMDVHNQQFILMPFNQGQGQLQV